MNSATAACNTPRLRYSSSHHTQLHIPISVTPVHTNSISEAYKMGDICMQNRWACLQAEDNCALFVTVTQLSPHWIFFSKPLRQPCGIEEAVSSSRHIPANINSLRTKEWQQRLDGLGFNSQQQQEIYFSPVHPDLSCGPSSLLFKG
jgi:hypothetical protein